MAKDDNTIEELTNTQQRYLKIYHAYFVLNWSQYKIAEEYGCSTGNISTAIKWVNNNKLNLTSKLLIEGAIESVRQRLDGTKLLYEKESKRSRKTRDSKLILGLLKEIREDEKLLYKLQEIISENKDEDSGLSAASVLKLIKEASNE